MEKILNLKIEEMTKKIYPYLEKLWYKGTDFLGCRYAILGGAMTWISDHVLVSAISEAGGFGVLAGGSLSPNELEKEILLTKQKTKKPFGVNLIIFHPKINELIDVCGNAGVSHIFLGGGLPSQEIVSRIKQTKSKAIGFVPSLAVGKRLVKIGIDAIVIEGNEAGGHVGPVTTSVLAQEILPFFELPIFVAGGIGDGRGLLTYLFMGAAGCQLGTRFVCSSESCAHANFKNAFIKANARDATLSPQLDPRFPIIPVRGLENKGKENFLFYQKEIIAAYDREELSKKEAQMKIELFWAGALKKAVIDGNIEEGSLMAGQSVGMVKAIEPCNVIIQSIIQEAVEYMSEHPLIQVA